MAYPIYPGMDVKFQITTEWDDFLLTEDDFTITIKDRWGRVRQVVTKNDCFYDSDGRFYFTMEAVRRGLYYAFFEGTYEDDDYDKQKATVTDWQQLLEVPMCAGDCDCHDYHPTHRKPCDCKCCHKVHYQIVTVVSVDGADYLADCYGRYIYTSDNKRIQFTSETSEKIEDMGKVKMKMTGEEFLRKWESFDPNNEVDTIPELMHAMQGISDDKTIKEDVEQQMSEHDTENEAQDSDIDSIFDDETGSGEGVGEE